MQAELQTILRAEKEGRADAKQMQLKKQIQERLTALEQEEAEKPQQYAVDHFEPILEVHISNLCFSSQNSDTRRDVPRC